ncbi:MAG: hypothetical protein V1773_04780 [bacterium]
MCKKVKFISVIIAVSIFLISCSSATKITSSFSQNSINVDGNQSDWQGQLKPISGEGLAVGFKNDNEKLYICLITTDRAKIMKILHQGLTVWIEPDGSDRSIGIKYPIKPNVFDLKKSNMMDKKENGIENIEEMTNKLLETQTEYSIVNQDNYPLYSYQINTQDNLKIKAGYQNYQFVYELGIKLNDDKLINLLENNADNLLKVGFVTEKFEMPERPDNMGGGDGMEPPSGGGMEPPSGGGMGGMGGGRPPMGGMQGGMQDSMKQLDYWFDVKLTLGKQ